jgi:NADH-quinone oxidoreductase subunit L
LILGALMTAFYMTRLYVLTFWGKFRGTHEQEHHLHESPLSMTVPLMVLGVLSVVGGYFLEHYIDHNLGTVVSNLAHEGEENHSLHTMMWGVTGIVLAVAAIAFSYFLKDRKLQNDAEMEGFTKTVYNKYYIDEIYNTLITKPLNSLSEFTDGVIEKSGIDGVVNSVGHSAGWLSNILRRTQQGNVGVYFFAMVVAIVVILALKVF